MTNEEYKRLAELLARDAELLSREELEELVGLLLEDAARDA